MSEHRTLWECSRCGLLHVGDNPNEYDEGQRHLSPARNECNGRLDTFYLVPIIEVAALLARFKVDWDKALHAKLVGGDSVGWE